MGRGLQSVIMELLNHLQISALKESDFISGSFKSGRRMQSRDYKLFSSFLAGECYATMSRLSCEFYTPVQFYQGVLFGPWKTGLETYSRTFLSNQSCILYSNISVHLNFSTK